MPTPEQHVVDQIDGRDSDKNGRPTLPWRLTKLYRRVTGVRGPFGTPVRKEGGSTDNRPGTEWNTPSTLDEITVLAEIHTQVYVDPDTAEELTEFDIAIKNYEMLKKLVGDQ